MEQIITTYYKDNAKKLRDTVDGILMRFGGLSDKDYDDFYSLANEVFTYVIKRYDTSQSFHRYLCACLENKIKSEISKRNCYKRSVDRNALSLEQIRNTRDDFYLHDSYGSGLDMESEIAQHDEHIKQYLSGLSRIQRRIVNLKMNFFSGEEIKKILELTDREYCNHCRELRSYEKICILFNQNPKQLHVYEEIESMEHHVAQTMEKSKSDKMSIASIIKKMEKQTLRFDHPLQRESEQWSSSSMKGNLISDILQGNPIPPLVFAEQIVNGMAMIWNLDGRQRCTYAYAFRKDGFKISKNVRRYIIPYVILVGNRDGEPVYEQKECDIRGKRFSDLPEELKERFDDYTFETVQYLNCSSDDIAYHIARYNDGKPMTVSQKGITRLGERYARLVKQIAEMSFFKDIGNYKAAEYKNGTVNRIVIEGIMASYYLHDWKKQQEEMCEYIQDHASESDFRNFACMIKRLENIITPEIATMFNSKDSFLWFGLFARHIKNGTEDMKFIDFLKEFADTLHEEKLDGVSFDELNTKATKDKNAVLAKMRHLERLQK